MGKLDQLKPIPLMENFHKIYENEYVDDNLKKKIKKEVEKHWDVNQQKDPNKDGPVVAKHLSEIYANLAKLEKFKDNYEKMGEAYKKQNEINIYTNTQHKNYLESALKKLEKEAGKEFPVAGKPEEDDDLPF